MSELKQSTSTVLDHRIATLFPVIETHSVYLSKWSVASLASTLLRTVVD